MGLLLSILVFSVGVMEVIACVRHIQYGYIPEWAPRYHVLATGTAGLTKLREHWRKKPSKSLEYGNKPKRNKYDVSRSCDIPCYVEECQEFCEQIDKPSSSLQQNENISASNVVSTDIGEFNLRYQEFEEVLSEEANTSNKLRDSQIHEENIVCDNLVDISSQIVVNCDSRTPKNLPCLEDIATEEHQMSSFRSQSPSPMKSKATTTVINRPTTPTTVEDDGGRSSPCGSKFLVEDTEDIQSPLSVRTVTHYTYQPPTPVLVADGVSVDVGDITQTSEKTELEAVNGNIQTTGITIVEDTGLVDTISFPSHEEGTVPDPAGETATMSASEEDKALEICVNQKRRTSKTEYLPYHEELATTISQKELTPEPTFASQNEEPIRLKPTKATSFEEARLEQFKIEPLQVEMSTCSHDEARRSSILGNIEVLNDTSAIIGRIEIKSAVNHPEESKLIKSEDSVKSIENQEQTEPAKGGVEFNDNPDIPVLEVSGSVFDDEDSYLEDSKVIKNEDSVKSSEHQKQTEPTKGGVEFINNPDIPVLEVSGSVFDDEDSYLEDSKVIKIENSVKSSGKEVQKEFRKKGVKFNDDPDVSVLEVSVPLFDEEDSHLECFMPSEYDTDIPQSLIEETAVQFVDELLDEAKLKISTKSENAYHDCELEADQCLIPKEDAGEKNFGSEPSNKLQDYVFEEDCTSVKQDERIIDDVSDTVSQISVENSSCPDLNSTKPISTTQENILVCDDVYTNSASLGEEKNILPESKCIENDIKEEIHSTNDPKETKLIGEIACDNSTAANNTIKDIPSDNPVSTTSQETKDLYEVQQIVKQEVKEIEIPPVSDESVISESNSSDKADNSTSVIVETRSADCEKTTESSYSNESENSSSFVKDEKDTSGTPNEQQSTGSTITSKNEVEEAERSSEEGTDSSKSHQPLPQSSNSAFWVSGCDSSLPASFSSQ